MLNVFGPASRYCDGVSRRGFLKIGVLAMGATSLTLANLYRAEAQQLFTKLFPEQEPLYSAAKLKWVCDFIRSGRPKDMPLGFMTTAGWQETMNYLFDEGLVTRKINPKTVFTTEFLR